MAHENTMLKQLGVAPQTPTGSSASTGHSGEKTTEQAKLEQKPDETYKADEGDIIGMLRAMRQENTKAIENNTMAIENLHQIIQTTVENCVAKEVNEKSCRKSKQPRTMQKRQGKKQLS